jgi:hypothetical protein
MPETLPIADAMEQAQAALDAEQPVDEWGLGPDEDPAERGDTLVADDHPPEAAVPVQVPLFEPPPFDFEAAYDELHRLDQRARLRKSAWEIAKSEASDCKKSYDTAIEDLHKKFAEIERARSEALKPRLTTEGGEPQMGEDETIEVPEEKEPDETPSDEAPAD